MRHTRLYLSIPTYNRLIITASAALQLVRLFILLKHLRDLRARMAKEATLRVTAGSSFTRGH